MAMITGQAMSTKRLALMILKASAYKQYNNKIHFHGNLVIDNIINADRIKVSY
jgi:hypothetical protein